MTSDWSPDELELIDRYLAGVATPDEWAQAEVLLARDPESASRYRIAVDAVSEQSASRPDGREMWVQLRSRITAPTDLDLHKVSRSRSPNVGGLERQPLRQRMWYVAVSVAIGALGVVFGRNASWHHDLESTPNAMQTYTTTTGQRANIRLSDGSSVALNVASQLKVPVDYAAGNHTVQLSGEALFTVPRHNGVPFTVVAGATTARVLGTSFVVRHYATDTTAVVAVQEGKVAVGNVVVTAARLLEIGPRGMSHLRPADESQFGFATGVKKLTGMPLSQAIPELNRWYGTDIHLADSSLAHIPITGEFLAGSVSDLAELLRLILDVRVVRDGRILTLYQKAK